MGEYYMPGPRDGFLNRAVRFLRSRQRPRPRFPRAIQIQTTSRCNANCLFCGYHTIKNTHEHGAMDDALFKRIADECGRHYIGRISPYLMNEPLMDRKLPERIAYIHRIKKFGTKTKINSNGYLLDEEMSRGLVESGLRHLWISVQGYSEATYRESMGLDLKRTLANIDRFIELRAGMKSEFPKLTVTTLRTTLTEPELDYAARYWSERQVRFKTHDMDNRAGKNLAKLALRQPKRREHCDLFLKQAYILYNGDMVLCCHDWKRTVVLGNVGQNSIEEIWNSPSFIELIRQYQAGDFSNLEICRTCVTT
jgi:radical SAM protein with 4Fe4S-binding SPASM domain